MIWILKFINDTNHLMYFDLNQTILVTKDNSKLLFQVLMLDYLLRLDLSLSSLMMEFPSLIAWTKVCNGRWCSIINRNRPIQYIRSKILHHVKWGFPKISSHNKQDISQIVSERMICLGFWKSHLHFLLWMIL